MFIGAPTTLILTERGIIGYNNVGNEITADKTYDKKEPLGEFFNKIEGAKVKIKDTYINYLPFFLKITNAYKPLKSSLDQPMLDWMQRKGNALALLNCKHIYKENIVAPTCTEEGYTEKSCIICGESHIEKTALPLGHSFEERESFPADCENDGYTLAVCTVCSESETRNIVKATGHSFEVTDNMPATCTKEGWFVAVCSACGMSYEGDTPTTAHTYADGVCTVCKEAETDATDAPDADGHEHLYKTETVLPTCTEGGYDLHTCVICQGSSRDNATLPVGHRYTLTVIAPTCTEDGYTERRCEYCGDLQKTDVIAATGHSYTVTTVAPTYTEEGYDLHVCTRCKDTYKDNTVEMLVDNIPQPTTTPDAEGTTYSASLKTTDNIFRHYSITAKAPDGVERTTYARIVKLDRETLYNNMLDTVKLVNAMVEKDRNVNWYFSFATNIEATEIGTQIMPQESTYHIYKDFLEKVDPSVKVSAVAVNSFSDYFDKFYITDHHWNHHGSEEAYLGIVRMLRENYPEITPIEVEEVYEFEDVKFFGSLARAHANYGVWDTYGVYYRLLPTHSLTRDRDISYGSSKTQSVNLEKYKNGEFSTASGYNHYTEFYRVAKKISYGENNTGRNLLLIGDSYSLPLLEVVSAHFDNTFVRYEDRSWKKMPEELIYEDFIEENDITDVIVIEEMAKSIMQGYGTAYPSGFLNIFPDENW